MELKFLINHKKKKNPRYCQILIKSNSPLALFLIPVSNFSSPGLALLLWHRPIKSIFHTKW